MNNQKNEKKRFYFNFIDVILIVAILSATLLLVYFLKERKIVISDDNQRCEVVYELEFSPMREEFKNLIEVGSILTDADSLRSIGEVNNVTYSPCYYIGFNKENGQPVKTIYPERTTMTLTVKASAEITDSGYLINGREITLNKHLSIRTPEFTGVGKPISITLLTEDAESNS